MRSALALLVLLSITALPAHAAGLNRCIGADGVSIFTDKPCEAVGATVRTYPAPAASASSRLRLRVRVCSRTTDDLLHGLQSALAARDVNQVAAFYHWPGISGAVSEGILKRLQAIVDRPLLSIDLIHPQQAQQAPDADGYQLVASEQASEAIGLQIVQSRTDTDDAPIRTEFALTQYIGCWWIRFQ